MDNTVLTPEELTAIRERCNTYRTEEQFDGVYIEVYLADVEQLLKFIERLTAENKTLRGENCLKCGLYQNAHKGSCDGCRWRDKE